MKASEAKEILKASGLSNRKLYAIWDLCQRKKVGDENGKGFLKRNEWILNLHIMRKVKLGFPVPLKIPDNMLNFLNEYEQKRMSYSTGFDSVTLAKSKLLNFSTSSTAQTLNQS